MVNTPIKKFLLRFTIIYAIHLMIKGFDYSFDVFTNFTYRGFIFSTFFITLWMFVWYFAEFIYNKLRGKNQIIALIINMLIGYATSLFTNRTYRWIDINVFDRAYSWENINYFNPELTMSLLMFYLITYGINIYMEKNLTIKEHIIKTEKLEKENAIAQYMSLKAQIEPHFLFNSLSVLSGIVHTNPDLASDFIVKLSKTLRYIIEQNENKLVPLNEELTIVNDYFFLLKTRFNSAIVLENNINRDIIKNSYIPPATLQMLIENAVQHNKLSEKYPLVVSLSNNNNYIIIENRIQRKDTQSTSTGKGLLNIRKRYDLITMREVTVTEYDNMFTVKVPILRKTDYERINN